MIITTTVKLKGETRPCEHLALVFPGPMGTEDLIAYRNAMTEAVKAILTSGDFDGYLSSECFYLLQMAEFITDSLDEEAEKTSKMIRSLTREIDQAGKEAAV